MEQKRIAILTLSHAEPLLLLAGLKDGKLHILQSKQLTKDLDTLKETLPPKLKSMTSSGFIVLVDEVLPNFAQYGRGVRLQHEGADGRPVVVSALEAYRNLKNLNAITYPDGGSGTLDISESIVEEVRDAKGRVNYNVDWSEIRPENAALLLAVHAATNTTLYDVGATKALFEALGANNKPEGRMAGFLRMCQKIDKKLVGEDS